MNTRIDGEQPISLRRFHLGMDLVPMPDGCPPPGGVQQAAAKPAYVHGEPNSQAGSEGVHGSEHRIIPTTRLMTPPTRSWDKASELQRAEGANGYQRLCIRPRRMARSSGPDRRDLLGLPYIDLLWLRTNRRGYGHRLMTLAEEEARERGAKNAYLDTFSFQAPDFYRRLGYEVFGELPDFPHGHQRYFFRKQL
jgi:hypothetical protein